MERIHGSVFIFSSVSVTADRTAAETTLMTPAGSRRATPADPLRFCCVSLVLLDDSLDSNMAGT